MKRGMDFCRNWNAAVQFRSIIAKKELQSKNPQNPFVNYLTTYFVKESVITMFMPISIRS